MGSRETWSILHRGNVIVQDVTPIMMTCDPNYDDPNYSLPDVNLRVSPLYSGPQCLIPA
jgi:hypothetical protein